MTGADGGATYSGWGWWRDRRPPATRLRLDMAEPLLRISPTSTSPPTT